jgi:hypothetical protein
VRSVSTNTPPPLHITSVLRCHAHSVFLTHVSLTPAPAFLHTPRFYAASEPKLPSFTPHQLSSCLAALASLTPDRPPPPSWSAAALQQVGARLPSMSAPRLVNTLWGLLELGMNPHRGLVSR